jgi:hypothetical protein
MKFRLVWKVVMLAAIAAVGFLRAGSAETNLNHPNTVKLFVRAVPISVLGKTVKVVTIDQSDGMQGFSPDQSGGFHVKLVNQLPVPTSIHWHGLVLPNLGEGRKQNSPGLQPWEGGPKENRPERAADRRALFPEIT